MASKLAELFKADRKDFELKWDYMDVFVKYGILSEEKFAEKAKEFCLISDVDKKRHTLQEFVDLSKTNQVDKNNKTILLYANNKDTEYTSIKEAKERGYAVALFDGVLDNHFTGYLEQNFEDLMCKRVDAAPVDKLVEKDEETVNILSEEETAKLKDIFAKQIADDTYEVQAEAL